jgi:GNAT superfamily N-acetyltransferase
MSYRIRRVEGAAEALAAMHTLTLPYDDHEPYDQGWWWIAFDESGEPVGFAGMRPATTAQNSVYFSRCGVLSGHRGQGLQKRLLRARAAYARSLGMSAVITTTFENPPSANNLIRAGFRQYQPEAPWGQPGTCYWRLTLACPPASTHPGACTA